MYQVNTNPAKFVMGSAKIQIGTSIAQALMNPDIGGLKGVKFATLGATGKVDFDNAEEEIRKAVTGSKVSYTYGEIDLNTIFQCFGSAADTLTLTPGTPIPAQSDVIPSNGWAFDTPMAFSIQNASGGKITPASVTGSVDGALVLGTDYFLQKNGNTWGLVIISGKKASTIAQTITVVYPVTPATGKVYSVNASNGIPSTFAMVLTHTTDDGKIFQIQIYAVQSSAFFTFDFAKDGGTDIALPTGEFTSKKDNLGRIYQVIDTRVY